MKFSNENVRDLVTHSQTILSIFQFSDNSNQHMVSISADSEVKEWREKNGELIQTVYLKRPSQEFLIKNSHTQEKVPKLKLSKFFIFKEKIFLGYEDGLIMAWIQKKEELNKNEGNDYVAKDEFRSVEDSECYKNIYYLDLILIGHKQQILDLYYYPTKNQLVSTSVDYSIKYWDLNDGSVLYHFNLDTIAIKILPYKDKKSEYFIFLCKENVKITINTMTENVSINTTNFPFSYINNILEYNQMLFLACYSPTITVLQAGSLTKVTEILDIECNEIYNLAIWNNYLISLGNDKMIKFWDMKKNYKKDFYLEGSRDDASCLFLKGNFCYFGGYDRKVYKLNIKGESNTNYDRTRMMEEEKASILFNNYLKTRKKVKSGKGKGKKPESGKKPTSAGKKPTSAGKKPTSGKKDSKPPSGANKKEEKKKASNSVKPAAKSKK